MSVLTKRKDTHLTLSIELGGDLNRLGVAFQDITGFRFWISNTANESFDDGILTKEFPKGIIKVSQPDSFMVKFEADELNTLKINREYYIKAAFKTTDINWYEPENSSHTRIVFE